MAFCYCEALPRRRRTGRLKGALLLRPSEALPRGLRGGVESPRVFSQSGGEKTEGGREGGREGGSHLAEPFPSFLPFCKLTTANEATNERTNANRLFIAAFKGLFDF